MVGLGLVGAIIKSTEYLSNTNSLDDIAKNERRAVTEEVDGAVN